MALWMQPGSILSIQIFACEFRRLQNLGKPGQGTHLTSFCGDDEEHDPSDEFEEYLACAACGDNGKNVPHKVCSDQLELIGFLHHSSCSVCKRRKVIVG